LLSWNKAWQKYEGFVWSQAKYVSDLIKKFKMIARHVTLQWIKEAKVKLVKDGILHI
jgi:hypothetical protein